MKVGIMGGTFDPIHIGHLIAAQCAYEQAGLDEVWFMPTSVPPHKPHAPAASPQQRWDMVCRAIEGETHFHPFDMELEKGGVSYTFDTVVQLKKKFPDHHFYYIIGADMVQYLPNWFKIEELVRLVLFIGLQRPGYMLNMESLPHAVRDAVTLVPMPLIELSSTSIRHRKSDGKTIRHMIPDQVYEYIEVNGIYGS
jgi:nicotinate-nucleotide adenylyltransferase